jgi:tetratricopeptide (TPR) repeat protein
MSFFSKLFGGTFEDRFNEGKRLFEEKKYGQAKLCLEHALCKTKGAAPQSVEEARTMTAECRRQLATAKIAEADTAVSSGDLEGAFYLLKDAEDICDEDAIADAVHKRLKSFESADTRSLQQEVNHIEDDEMLTIIGGTWTEDQAQEYAAMPEELRRALLADHDGRHEEAAQILKKIIERSDLEKKPKYLYFELGKVLLACEQFGPAIEMLDTFIDASKDDDRSLATRLVAYDIKADAMCALERFDEAEETFRAAAKAAPENHEVFRKLGVYLRGRKKFDSSIRALERARDLMGQMHPDFAVIREMGFTYLAMEKKDDALECFASVIEHLASKGEHTQFDPVAAVTLAGLYEERNELQKAADLFRHLAVGYDTANHFNYNMHAARLLKRSNANRELVERYLIRARELAETDEQNEAIDKLEEK